MTNTTAIQSLLDRQIGKGHVYNVVAGVQSTDGRVDFAGAAGTADPASGAAMTPDTPYLLASITKMYTASVIIRLHEEGRLSLDEPISAYLPASLIEGIHVYRGQDHSARIRVHQLVDQTSGLADYFEDKPRGGRSVFDDLKDGRDRRLDLAHVLAITRGLSAHFEPGAGGGTKAHYSDTNYRLLGAIIESVTGRSTAECFAEMIFTPLNLAHTWVYDAADQRRPKPAALFLRERAVNVPQFLTSNVPDGGIVSTVRESLAFLRAFFEGRLFDPKLFARMMGRWNGVFFPIQYGYGMMRIKMPRIFSPFQPSPEFIGHSGSSGSFAYHCRERGLYLAGTVNQIAAPSRPIRLMMRIASMVG